VEHHSVHVKYVLGLDEGEVQFKRELKSLEAGSSTPKRILQKPRGRWRRPSIICREAFRIFMNDTTSELSLRHEKY
jgi:hypothetical protein